MRSRYRRVAWRASTKARCASACARGAIDSTAICRSRGSGRTTAACPVRRSKPSAGTRSGWTGATSSRASCPSRSRSRPRRPIVTVSRCSACRASAEASLRTRPSRCRSCCRIATSARTPRGGSPASWSTRLTQGPWRPSRRSRPSTARSGRSWRCGALRTACGWSTGPTRGPSASCCWVTPAQSSTASPRSAPTAACCERRSPSRRMGWYSPRPSAPTCSSMRRPVTQQLATDSAPPTERDLAGAVRRAVALVEQELDDAPNMLTMRELAEVPDDDSGERLITVVDQGTDGQTRTVARFRTAACHFEDTVTFFPVLGRWEVWQLINLTGDTHPIHIHLNPFHVLARRPIMVTVPDGGITDTATSARVHLGRSPDDALEHVLDGNEQGLKDTVRVNPNEIVELAVRFEGFSGRYMYHCHILEHEDRDMMRPIVVMPEQLGPFMS